MSALANTAASQMIGAREDLEDTIYRVAPEKTPFLSTIGKKKATARLHEWQTEALAAPDATNATLEGNDSPAITAPTNSLRMQNYCQIFTKTLAVSRTQEIVDKAGRKSEVNRQKVNRGIEIRRDMEKRFIGNYLAQPEADPATRLAAGLLACLRTNVSRGAGGANATLSGTTSGYPSTAATLGTQRTFTEALMKAAWLLAFNNGATPSVAFMGGATKQTFSSFTGIADIRGEVTGREQATITAAADIYVGDFGALSAVPHPYGLTRDFVAIDPDYVSVATLDGFSTDDLGKTGDTAAKKLMTHEATLVVENELAHFQVADLS